MEEWIAGLSTEWSWGGPGRRRGRGNCSWDIKYINKFIFKKEHYFYISTKDFHLFYIASQSYYNMQMYIDQNLYILSLSLLFVQLLQTAVLFLVKLDFF